MLLLRPLAAVGLVAWQAYACGGGNGEERRAPEEHATELAAEVRRRTIPSGTLGITTSRTDAPACRIGREWVFVVVKSRAEYVEWASAQLAPDFQLLAGSGERLVFSRYERGDAQSVTLESRASSDGTRVRVILCVFPD